MRLKIVLSLPVLIAFLSCGLPAGKSAALSLASMPAVAHAGNCPDFFYYYNKEKIPLKVYSQIVLIGFEPGQDIESQRQLLGRFAEFESLGNGQLSGTGPFTVVKLKPATTCKQVLALLKKLQKQPEVTFANPTFSPPHTLGTAYPWVGIAPEFLVTLKSVEGLSAFKRAVAETNTKIVDALGETVFLVQATKASKGNALEMANYFHEQPFVQASEPDFFLPSPEKTVAGE